MIANGCAIDIRQPVLQQLPSGTVIWTDAGLRQQFCRANAALMGVAALKIAGQLQPRFQRQLLTPLAGMIIQHRGG